MNNKLLIGALPVLFFPAQQAQAKKVCPDKPNIVLIMADDMGFSDPGFMGSGIRTPNIDGMAENGAVFSHFYNTGRSCPTRASLLTGLYAHQTGVGWMTAANLGQPGYTGDLNEHSVTVAQVLRETGYACYMTGKWHVTYDGFMGPDGPKHNWPVQRGFDRFFGHLTGGGSYFTTNTLTNDNEQISPPADFYLTTAVTDSTVSIMNKHFREKKDQPFFFYVAYYAPHRPLHALQQDIEKYRGKFMTGWDENRKQRYEKLRELHMINAGCRLSDRDPEIPAWDDLTEDEKKVWDARMAVYAAQIDCMDQGIGKILQTLKENGELENTLVLFLSDNGGCAEAQGKKLDVKDLASLGNEEPAQSYRVNWANVSNTPFREYKHFVHEGGISTPLIAYWPGKIKKTGAVREQTGHVTDLMPTFIELSGAGYPQVYKGHEIYPLQGKSLLPAIVEDKSSPRGPVFFEHEANRAVIDGDWKLVSKGTKTPPYTGTWELYNLKEDRSELNNLIAGYPEKAEQLRLLWEKWAEENHVYPLDNSGWQGKQQKDVRRRKYETDITGTKYKADAAEEFLPVAESPFAVRNAIYADASRPAAERTADLIRRLTFEEKLSLSGGFKRFLITPVPRLGIRPVFMADASQGVRMKTVSVKGKASSFPGMLPLASTWNKDIAAAFGKAIAEECRALGVDILLGPGINIQRLSVGGRNFEYMGEDPFLTGQIASAYISGMEGTGVLSCPKHFIANDQEFCRHIADVRVSERALREIYLPPWEVAVTAGKCSAIMTGNNLVNGIPAAVNRPLNEQLLRKEYAFQGIAMTDWQNTNYFPGKQDLVLTSGENLLMPDNTAFAGWVEKECRRSPDRKAEIETMLEKMIYPTLFTLFDKGIYDRVPLDKQYADDRIYSEHQALARQCATEAIVMLKNEKKILPVGRDKKIVMYGEPEIHSGEGSGFVEGYDHTGFAQGLKAVYQENFHYLSDFDEKMIGKADVVILNINKKSGEGRDIPFEGEDEQLDVLKKITRLNRHVIVLLSSCNVLPMDWLKDTEGLLWCYFLGQERGNALADIISGKVSPSGKLPFTVERAFSDSPDPDFNFIGNKPFWKGNNQYKKYWLEQESDFDTAFTNHVKPHEVIPVPYEEETLVGYRWYGYHHIPVVFPFGFGLSYAAFVLDDLNVNNSFQQDGTVKLSLNIRNTGKMTASEVVQIYVSDKESTVIRAPKELRAFQKVSLKPGESKRLDFTLDRKAFAFWDDEKHDWKIEPGEFIVSAGNSSADPGISTVIRID